MAVLTGLNWLAILVVTHCAHDGCDAGRQEVMSWHVLLLTVAYSPWHLAIAATDAPGRKVSLRRRCFSSRDQDHHGRLLAFTCNVEPVRSTDPLNNVDPPVRSFAVNQP